jgi:hypothetical protein
LFKDSDLASKKNEKTGNFAVWYDKKLIGFGIGKEGVIKEKLLFFGILELVKKGIIIEHFKDALFDRGAVVSEAFPDSKI